jgi:hypothetical protein
VVDKQKPLPEVGDLPVGATATVIMISNSDNTTLSPKMQHIDNGLCDGFSDWAWPEPPMVTDLEKTAYFRGGFHKWNGKFIDNLPEPEPINPETLENAVGNLSNVSNHHERATGFQSLPPLVGVRCYKNNVELVRAAGEYRGGGARSQCKEISQEQYKKAIRTLTDSEVELNSILTPTYPETYSKDGRIFKAHLKRYLERLREEFGDFDYFLAIEYQKRGAPHCHIGLSVDLAKFGEVITLKREPGKRRSETFQTVEELNRKAFDLWRDTIAWHENGVIRYNGEPLDWWGISEADYQKMERAFVEYNSGVSWEVMREKDGAKNYFVKELTGKKGNGKGFYQKSVPEGFKNPGRHFLYSRGFVNRNNVEFSVDYDTLCYVVQESKLEHAPENHKPLYKWLWNASVRVANHLIKMGYRPACGGFDYLRKYWDVRAYGNTATHVGALSLGAWALASQWARASMHWKARCRRLLWDQAWSFSLANAP